jgi:Putative zinc-finger
MALHLVTLSARMPDSPAAHLTDETVAAYLERVLPISERSEIDRHLGDCDDCRARVALAGHVLQTAPREHSYWRRLALPGLAAAAVLAGVLLLSRPAAGPVTPSEIRGAGQESSMPAVHIVGPLRGASIATDALRFIWSGVGSEALYQVTVSAADGQMLWSTRTADTISAPPPELLRQLRPGQRYFWRVDALLPTLRSVTSADQPFQISR